MGVGVGGGGGTRAVTTPITLVLDTNVVIDWLVFDDPFMNPLRFGVRDGQVAVVTHLPAIDELKRVLAYPQLKLTEERQHTIFSRYQLQTNVTEMPPAFTLKNLLLPGGFPRCRDRDDEHFLALAFHARANALVSRDNAVLGLRIRAETFGMTIMNVPELIAFLTVASGT